jgi:hypothetical protein
VCHGNGSEDFFVRERAGLLQNVVPWKERVNFIPLCNKQPMTLECLVGMTLTLTPKQGEILAAVEPLLL